jgi:hypothetical protein
MWHFDPQLKKGISIGTRQNKLKAAIEHTEM